MKAFQPIRRKQEFDRIFNQGRCLRGTLLRIWILKNAGGPSEQTPRLAMLVSRRMAPQAVSRNTWRRRIREILRRELIGILTDQSLIVQVTRKGDVPESSEIARELRHLLGKR